MERADLIFTGSAWWIALCFIVGVFYAFFLYYKEERFSRSTRWVLATLRFTLVLLLCLLIMGPLVRKLTQHTEKPLIVLAVDNSLSVKQTTEQATFNQTIKNLNSLSEKLQEEGVDVRIEELDTLRSDVNAKDFNATTTNLSGLLERVSDDYLQSNLASVLLVSDGIYNQGTSPVYRKYPYPVYTIGLGDTVPRRDVAVRSLIYNKIAYLGNKFPLVAEVQVTGFKGQSLRVSVVSGAQTLETKLIKSTQEQELIPVDFQLSAVQKGLQHYVVQVQVLEGEYTAKNNVGHAYIDVLDGKEKILLIAAAPHPDIRAFKALVESNQNMELQVCIPGIDEYKDARYDLVIAYQVPSLSGIGNDILQQQLKKNIPALFVLGSQSNLNTFNQQNGIVKINSFGRLDKVSVEANKGFSSFGLDANNLALWSQLPPLLVPFGNYALQQGAQVILYQKVGSVVTDKPLIAIQTAGSLKTGVLTGEGWWQCRLQAFLEKDNPAAVDEVLLKTIQLLSSKEDKRKLRVYPISVEFAEVDKIVFAAEVYNDIYEKTYGTEISLKVRNEAGKEFSYSFINSEENSRIALGSLPHGIYHYTASGKVNNKSESVSGEFLVKEMQLELLSTQADHALLKQLAAQTGGRFVKGDALESLAAQLLKDKPQARLHATEEVVDIIQLQWIFFVLLALATAEWFIRKFKGGY